MTMKMTMIRKNHSNLQDEQVQMQEDYCGSGSSENDRGDGSKSRRQRVGRKCAAYLMLLAVLIAHKSKKVHAFVVHTKTVATPLSKKRSLTDIQNSNSNNKLMGGRNVGPNNRNWLALTREEVQSLTALHLWWKNKNGGGGSSAAARNTDLATTSSDSSTVSADPTDTKKKSRITSSSSTSTTLPLSSSSSTLFSLGRSFVLARNDTGEGATAAPLLERVDVGTAADEDGGLNGWSFTKELQRQQQQSPLVVPSELLAMTQPLQKVLDENTSGWALSYADLRPDNPSTPAGVTFLATNVAYALAGILLTLQGDTFFGVLTDVTAAVSFNYHYNQLDKAGTLKEDSVRLALLVDYVFAFFAMGTAFVYFVMNSMATTDVLSDPASLEAVAAGGLGILFLGLGWIWEVGRPYMICHSLWHLFSAYAGYIIGATHSHLY